MSKFALALLLALFVSSSLVHGQDLAVKPGASPLPTELAEPVRAALAEPSTTVTRGDATIEFWWVKSAWVKPGTAAVDAWTGVAEGSLVGAIRIDKPLPDIRGMSIKPGVYTLRYASQPQDGDHMGASPFREFLLVSQAALDTTADPVGYKGAVALAKKTGSKPHPASLSLDPPVATAEPGTVVTNEAGLKAVVFRVPVHDGKASLPFGVVLVGKIEHQQ